jgi:prepilin-type processing-associated H-X9-DG protein
MRAYIVIAVVIVFLAAITFPAVQAAREAARRMQCGNNIKLHCLALQNYQDTLKYFPYGAQNRPMDEEFAKISWGKSWLVAILDFKEARPEIRQIYEAEQTRAGSCYTSQEVRSVVDGKRFMGFVCPSSPLPEWQTLAGGRLQVPSYAGIMGGTSEANPKAWEGVADDRIVSAPYGGQAAGNGMLVINESLSYVVASFDGWANTIVIGEVSDWYFDDSGAKRNPSLSIGDAGDIAFDEEAGWLAGNNLRFIDNPLYNPEKDHSRRQRVGLYVYKDGPAILNNSVCNLITIDHPIGSNNRGGRDDAAPNWGTKGIGRCGFNNPLLSAHPAGAMVGFLDGHVQLLPKQTSLVVLKKLAIRDNEGIGCADF